MMQARQSGGRQSGGRQSGGREELLLSVGAEGGPIAVYGNGVLPGRGFRAGIFEHAPTRLDLEGGITIRSDSGWLASWAEARVWLDRYPWPHLTPIYVACEWRESVWAAFTTWRNGDGLRSRNLRIWKHLCRR